VQTHGSSPKKEKKEKERKKKQKANAVSGFKCLNGEFSASEKKKEKPDTSHFGGHERASPILSSRRRKEK
jgi:hypothetical protein